ncbi:MAG: DeoR/GlpR transcriptional regulator [Sphingobacteriales bacterium]|nr:MAG: DeoR/GlpR transcriptional regulator [Sphingobacteriales bacterium]
MIREERFEYILAMLTKNERVEYDTVARNLQVSDDTVRRDIEMLHQSGLLSKVRGGAISRSKNPLSFQQRKSYLTKGKDTIALKAQQLIKKGQTIIMDGGTTNCAIACHFPINTSIRVITNNQALIPVLSAYPSIDIVVLGGEYDRSTETVYGAYACNEVRKYAADLYLMGTCAIDHRFGITAAVSTDGELKQAMLQSSKHTVVISNQEKLNTADHYKVCDLDRVETLITDLPSDHKKLDPYRARGFRIM